MASQLSSLHLILCIIIIDLAFSTSRRNNIFSSIPLIASVYYYVLVKRIETWLPFQIICLNGIRMQNKYSCIYYRILFLSVANLLIWFSNLNDTHTIIINIGEALPHYLCNNFFLEDKTAMPHVFLLFLSSTSWAMAQALSRRGWIHNSHVIFGKETACASLVFQ